MNRIIAGDCLDIMPTLDANSVDAVVTDPPYGLSFMGKDWDHGIPGVEFWKAAMRVMKPGAFLLSFGGTRTFHRLTCAIEDAGLEIRDCMMWLYGSGFPKSLDVSKAIDKAAGHERALIPHVEVNGKTRAGDCEKGWKNSSNNGLTFDKTASTDAARQWSGWGTALKPAWEPIIVARKPLEGTVAENVLKWGTGGMNIDGGRIAGESWGSRRAIKLTSKGKKGGGFGQTSWESIPGAKNIDLGKGRWPANVILDEEAGAMLDEQSGELKSGGGIKNPNGPYTSPITWNVSSTPGQNKVSTPDTGGASRFFYCAKTSKKERGEGNNHPTVKPISLLTYLAKLVCPPGGLILDPFAGSGSTGIAAERLGFKFIGIEKEEAYCEIARKRIEENFNLSVAI